MMSSLLRKRLLLFLVCLVCRVFVFVPEARAQAIVSLVPRKGEIRLAGTVTDVSLEKGRCVVLTTRVLTPEGTESALPQPKSKTITIGAGTTFAMLMSAENHPSVFLEEAGELKRGVPVFVIGRNGENGSIVSRLICLIAPTRQTDIVEETREPSEPPGKNLLLPTEHVENWGWNAMEPAKATLEQEDGLIKVNVTEAGKEDWRVQLSQSVVFPEPGVSYTLSFRARAEPRRRMRLSAQVLESDFHDIGINRVATIGPEWSHYEYTFVAHNLGAKGHILPVFFFGTEKGITWLADVTVAVSYPEQRGNLLESLSNPGAWKLLSLNKEGSAALRIGDNRLEVSTSAVGKEKQDKPEIAYQLLPAFAAPLVPGHFYVLTFRGSAGEERTIRIRGMAEPVKLGPDEHSFEVRFRVNRLADFGVCPTFLSGEQLGTFTLSNIVLREEHSDGKGKPR